MDISKIQSAVAMSDEVRDAMAQREPAEPDTDDVPFSITIADDKDLSPRQREAKSKIKAALRNVAIAVKHMPPALGRKLLKAIEASGPLTLTPAEHIGMQNAVRAAGITLNLALLGVPRIVHEMGHDPREYEEAQARLVESPTT